MKIFVQIASYRDPQLVPTIKDMLANAKKPNNLVIGIARQYSDEDGFDNLDEYKDDKRFRILNIPYKMPKVYVGQDTKFNNFTKVKRTHYKLILT
jgi:hypothetical protein